MYQLLGNVKLRSSENLQWDMDTNWLTIDRQSSGGTRLDTVRAVRATILKVVETQHCFMIMYPKLN